MVSPLIGAVAGGETQDGKSNTAFAENMRVLHLQREYARAQEQLALPHARADDEAFEIDATNLDVLIGWNHRIAAAEGTLGRVAQPVAAQQDMEVN